MIPAPEGSNKHERIGKHTYSTQGRKISWNLGSRAKALALRGQRAAPFPGRRKTGALSPRRSRCLDRSPSERSGGRHGGAVSVMATQRATATVPVLPPEIGAAVARGWRSLQLTREQIRAYFERRHPGQRIPLHEKVAVRCAFHSEDNPSCTLFLDGNGGFNCHACGAKGNLFQFEVRFSSCSLDQAKINVGEITGATPVPRREGEVNLGPPVAIYDYRDENAITLFQKRRYEPETGKKTFRIFHPADKGWKPGIDAKEQEKARRILYNLPDLVKANLVFFCEGEKDCQNVMDANLFAENAFSMAATTTFDGAWQQGHSPKWLDSYGSYFTGKQVVIFEDNDEPGRIYAATAAAAISKYALAVRVVSFPELPEGGDVSDYLAAGHTTQELEKRVKDAPKWIL